MYFFIWNKVLFTNFYHIFFCIKFQTIYNGVLFLSDIFFKVVFLIWNKVVHILTKLKISSKKFEFIKKNNS